MLKLFDFQYVDHLCDYLLKISDLGEFALKLEFGCSGGWLVAALVSVLGRDVFGCWRVVGVISRSVVAVVYSVGFNQLRLEPHLLTRFLLNRLFQYLFLLLQIINLRLQLIQIHRHLLIICRRWI